MNIEIPLLCISIVWVLSEIILTLTKHSDSSDSKRDKRSLRVIWITVAVCVSVGVTMGLRGVGFVRAGSAWIPMKGLALIVLGLIVRWISILTLRKYFTVDVSIAHDHRLVTRGIYRLIRHPAYTGSLLSFLGLGLVFSSWVTLIVIFVPMLLAFLYRIRVEEETLVEHFGDEYVQYCRSTKRLIPKVY